MATPWLDGHHVAFGIVVDGMDVLDAIEACGTASGKPTRYGICGPSNCVVK